MKGLLDHFQSDVELNVYFSHFAHHILCIVYCMCNVTNMILLTHEQSEPLTI